MAIGFEHRMCFANGKFFFILIETRGSLSGGVMRKKIQRAIKDNSWLKLKRVLGTSCKKA